MRSKIRAAAFAVTAVVGALAMPTASQAASIGDVCRIPQYTTLYTSPTTGYPVIPINYARILDFRGPYHYLARVDGNVGQLERAAVEQASCHP